MHYPMIYIRSRYDDSTDPAEAERLEQALTSEWVESKLETIGDYWSAVDNDWDALKYFQNLYPVSDVTEYNNHYDITIARDAFKDAYLKMSRDRVRAAQMQVRMLEDYDVFTDTREFPSAPIFDFKRQTGKDLKDVLGEEQVQELLKDNLTNLSGPIITFTENGSGIGSVYDAYEYFAEMKDFFEGEDTVHIELSKITGDLHN